MCFAAARRAQARYDVRCGGTLTGVTLMGPVSSVRSQVQTLGTSPQPSAGTNQGGASARTGETATPAAMPLAARPVLPAAGLSRAELPGREDAPDPGFAVESARARAEAAQRAYMMAQVAVGLNPLNDPLG